MKGESVAGSSPEQAAVPPPEHGETTEGAGGSSKNAIRTEEPTTSLEEKGTRRKNNRMMGWAKTLANTYVNKTKTLRQGYANTMKSSRAEAPTRQQQEAERHTMDRIKDGFREVTLRPRLTSSTFHELPPTTTTERPTHVLAGKDQVSTNLPIR